MTQFDVISALRLRGMRVLSLKRGVVQIDNPTEDFRRRAVEIIENINGIRQRCNAVRFHGVTVRWEAKPCLPC